MVRLSCAFTALLVSVHHAVALNVNPNVQGQEIQASQLLPSYDYVVVGGGQAGLVVATRLSEDPSKSILVVEYGVIDRDPAQLQPNSSLVYKQHLLYNLTSVAQPGLNNRTGKVYAAATAGGGSYVNGMMLNRAAPLDYDLWKPFGDSSWSFSGLLKYFKKSTQLTPPEPKLAREFNITYDLAAYGQKSPIQLSYATYAYPGIKVQYQAMIEAGVKPQKEQGLNGYDLVWYPSALAPKTVLRSYAVDAYYDPVSLRKNLHLLTYTRVNSVTFDKTKRATGIVIQPRDTKIVLPVKAKSEVIVAAGFLHTPQILQRSGVGPAALLKQAKIPVVVDLPGVGSNFQDHATSSASFTLNTDLSPRPGSLTTNATFAAWANELWAANRTGPLSMGVGMVGGWLPLGTLAPQEYKSIAATVKAQDVRKYLPKSYTREQIAGYKVQRDAIVKSYLSDKAGQIELPFYGAGRVSMSLEHPLSRGTILLNTTDIYAEPIVDYRTFSNPVDPIIIAKAYQFVRKWTATKSFQTLSPTEDLPGSAVQSDADLVAYIQGAAGASTAHGCCTAAMGPRSLGGVVASDLTVWGVKGLSVVDGSVMPMVPAAHTCATVYAIAEKAADLIKARHR